MDSNVEFNGINLPNVSSGKNNNGLVILLIILLLLIISIPVKFKVAFNVLKLSGDVQINVFKVVKSKFHIRFRGGYIYITQNGKTRREKITAKNFNLSLIVELIKQLYFRAVLNKLTFRSEVGYYNNAMITAIGSGITDISAKSLYAKILHNKKSAHILIQNDAKYNQDCLNIKVELQFNISIFDIIYSFNE